MFDNGDYLYVFWFFYSTLHLKYFEPILSQNQILYDF